MLDDSETITGMSEPVIQQILGIGLVLVLGTLTGLGTGAVLCSGWIVRLLAGS